MIVAIHHSDGIYYTEAESLAAVRDTLGKEEEFSRFWYDTITGERWEETCIMVEEVRLFREETTDPTGKGS